MLELSFNGIGALGAGLLSRALFGYRTLSVLKLDNNRMGDGGVTALASALPSMALQQLFGLDDGGAARQARPDPPSGL